MTRTRSITFLAGATALVVAALAAAGCGGSGGSNANSPAPPKNANGQSATVGVANENVGTILVDSQGRTLYLFQKDSGSTSSCTGACAAAWPPLRSSGNPVVRGGATASLVGTTARSDGKPQATYNGHPLYSFVMDTKSGDTNGEGLTAFGGTWFAVSPAGNSVRPPAPAAPKPRPQPQPNPIPQGNGGDQDSDNNGGPDDGDGGI